MSTPVVKVENLVKRYKELIAVDHFNLEIREGEILGLLGPNGSGKTTTINCILSLLSYDKGTIEVFGKEMQPDSYDSKRKIGVVMQNVAVFDALNVYDNIDYFCGLYIKDKQLRRQYVEEAIEFVGLSDYKKFYPKKLSGGLLRRLNIACGIAHKPKLIFLDEPTVAVDPQSRNRILEGILELNDRAQPLSIPPTIWKRLNRSVPVLPSWTKAKTLLPELRMNSSRCSRKKKSSPSKSLIFQMKTSLL